MLRYEPIQEGYRVYDSEHLVAIMHTKHNQGLVKNGAVVMEPMETIQWNLHFTKPTLPIDELKAIVKSLPTEP